VDPLSQQFIAVGSLDPVVVAAHLAVVLIAYDPRYSAVAVIG
jgi:hypothetical protein